MTIDPNEPDAALLATAKRWMGKLPRDQFDMLLAIVLDARKSEYDKAFRAGQSHERRADAGLLAALECYAWNFCETSFGGECCGKLSAIDCGGCAAYAAIDAAKGTDQ